MQKTLLLYLLFWLPTLVYAADEPPLLMVYHERLPYVYFDDHQRMQGLVGRPVQEAFEMANISLTWSEMPPNRQLLMIQSNDTPVCSLGWFKNSERERFAQFSDPVYQDHPNVGLAIASNDDVPDTTTLADLFQRKELTLLTKVGYSYGALIDEQIAVSEPNRISVTVDNTSMLKMLVAGRVDYFFLAFEEASNLIESQGLDIKDFKFIALTDAPPGEKRYVICSQKVSAGILEKFNAGLTEQSLSD